MLDQFVSEMHSWWVWLVKQADALETDLLLISLLWTAFVALLALIWASRASGKLRRLQIEVAAMRPKLEDLRTQYEREVKWRTAAERHEAGMGAGK
jgi:hypothetical protein